MNKGNVIRSIFWGLVLILFLALGIIGIIRNNKIYNKYKDDLVNISKSFKQNEIIENYKQVNNEITSKVRDKKIIITSKSVETTEYIFKLKNGYLTTKIDKSDTFGKTIIMALADSIAVNKGLPMGSTYSLFNDDSVLKYKLNDGIEYKDKKDSYIINISIINPIINKNEIINDNQNNEDNNINNNDFPNNDDIIDGEINNNQSENNLNNEENNPNRIEENYGENNSEANPTTLIENKPNYNENPIDNNENNINEN